MPGRVDTASRLVRAPASTIYRAFATPDAMNAWLPPRGMTGSVRGFAFHEGGGYRLRLTYREERHTPGKTSANSDEAEVRLLRLVPDKCIEQAVVFDSDDPAYSGEMRIAWTFESAHDGTLVTVRCENVPGGIRPEDHQAGLNSTLENLAAFAERNT